MDHKKCAPGYGNSPTHAKRDARQRTTPNCIVAHLLELFCRISIKGIFCAFALSKGDDMGDSKSLYSEASNYYIEVDVQHNDIDAQRYGRSKNRERKYNDNWMKNQVNLNEIVDRFTPDADGCRDGVKFVFENDRYRILADMPAGYLRIYDKYQKTYLMPNGEPCTDNNSSHFKIKKREEM